MHTRSQWEASRFFESGRLSGSRLVLYESNKFR